MVYITTVDFPYVSTAKLQFNTNNSLTYLHVLGLGTNVLRTPCTTENKTNHVDVLVKNSLGFE